MQGRRGSAFLPGSCLQKQNPKLQQGEIHLEGSRFVLSVLFGCNSCESTHYRRDRCQTLHKYTALCFISVIQDFIKNLYQFNQNQRDLYTS